MYMDINEALQKLIKSLQAEIGDPYNEERIDDFRSHLQSVIANGDYAIKSRINKIYVLWSNIDDLAGDDGNGIQNFPALYLLREYKFSITSEIGQLCSYVISKEKGKKYSMSTAEDLQRLTQLLKILDEQIVRERMNSDDSYDLLIKRIKKDIFNISGGLFGIFN